MLNLIIKTFIDSTNGIYYYKVSGNIKIKSDTLRITNENIYVIRDGDNFYKIINNLKNLPKDNNFNIILKLRKSLKNKNIYEIINPIIRVSEINKYENFINNLDESMWFPVKSNTNNEEENEKEDYILNENDIIKLGRLKLDVIKIHINKINKQNKRNKPYHYNISNLNYNSKPIFNIDIKFDQYIVEEKEKNDDDEKKENSNKKNKEKEENDSHETINYNSNKSTNASRTLNENKSKKNKNDIINYFDNNICFICLTNESTIKNPLVRICKCKSFAHYICLKAFLSKKLTIQENLKGTVTTYSCYKFNCDVCLSPYPLRFRIPEFNKVYEFIDINQPEEFNYVVLETLDYIKEKNNIKKVHFIRLKDEVIKIGRNNTNDIRDEDISISRTHCELKFDKDNGDIILENKSEKFGTLVLIRNNIKMNENEIKFQVGRSLISAKLCTKDVTEQTTEYNFG